MIEINGINKWYGKHHVLKDCSTHVDKGDIVVVCGPSGSGKSTLIKTVNGLEPIQRGDIRVEGISIIDPRTDLARLRTHVGMVFQHFELFPHLTVIQNLTIAQTKVLGRKEKIAVEKGHALLERVGLAEHAHKYPSQLSGGQQQRVAIARSLCMDPNVMLFDERSEEHTSELQSLMRISYAVFCLNKKTYRKHTQLHET